MCKHIYWPIQTNVSRPAARPISALDVTQEELIHSCQHFGTLIENRSPIIYDNGDEYGFVNRVESQDLNHTIQISIEDISETVRLRVFSGIS